MNKVIVDGKAKEIQGRMKTWWGKLTDDDLKKADGNVEKIVGLLQQKYGYTLQDAEQEYNLQIKKLKMAVNKV